MGKSDKKIKSDRIAALRKQYDTYIDDDKKRKERNMYILEKLDSMRSNKLVSYPVKYNHFNEDHLIRAKQEDLTGTSLMSCPKIYSNYQENELLNKIRKSYILIPKLTSINTTTTSGACPDIKICEDNNSDWKSKYDILYQLNKEENKIELPTRDCEVTSVLDTFDASDLKPKNVHISEEKIINSGYNKKLLERELKDIEQPDMKKFSFGNANNVQTSDNISMNIQKTSNELYGNKVVGNFQEKVSNFQNYTDTNEKETENGIHKFRQQQQEIENYQTEQNIPNNLNGNNVENIYYDNINTHLITNEHQLEKVTINKKTCNSSIDRNKNATTENQESAAKTVEQRTYSNEKDSQMIDDNVYVFQGPKEIVVRNQISADIKQNSDTTVTEKNVKLSPDINFKNDSIRKTDALTVDQIKDFKTEQNEIDYSEKTESQYYQNQGSPDVAGKQEYQQNQYNYPVDINGHEETRYDPGYVEKYNKDYEQQQYSAGNAQPYQQEGSVQDIHQEEYVQDVQPERYAQQPLQDEYAPDLQEEYVQDLQGDSSQDLQGAYIQGLQKGEYTQDLQGGYTQDLQGEYHAGLKQEGYSQNLQKVEYTQGLQQEGYPQDIHQGVYTQGLQQEGYPQGIQGEYTQGLQQEGYSQNLQQGEYTQGLQQEGYPQDIQQGEYTQGLQQEGYPQDIQQGEYTQDLQQEGNSLNLQQGEYTQGLQPEGYRQDIQQGEYTQGLQQEGYPQDLQQGEYTQGLQQEDYPQDLQQGEYTQDLQQEGNSLNLQQGEYTQGLQPEGYRQDIQQGEYTQGLQQEGYPQDLQQGEYTQGLQQEDYPQDLQQGEYTQGLQQEYTQGLQEEYSQQLQQGGYVHNQPEYVQESHEYQHYEDNTSAQEQPDLNQPNYDVTSVKQELSRQIVEGPAEVKEIIDGNLNAKQITEVAKVIDIKNSQNIMPVDDKSAQ